MNNFFLCCSISLSCFVDELQLGKALIADNKKTVDLTQADVDQMTNGLLINKLIENFIITRESVLNGMSRWRHGRWWSTEQEEKNESP